tara:strand:+ start:1136 stop:3451 length:2316 start_codon:yes stop_codon:yes gene_type:complete
MTEETKQILGDGSVLYTLSNGETAILDANPTDESLANFEAYKAEINAKEEQSADAYKIQSGSWMDDPLVASRMVLDGITLGWGNEALAGISAAANTLQGGDYSESYNNTFNQLVKEEQEYRGQYPAASLTLNLVGGLATGGVGALRVGATKAGSKLLEKTLTSKAKSATKTLGAGAGIGGIAGAGAADKADRLEGFETGAKWGLGGLVALKSAGFIYQGAAKQRVAKNLGKGDDFTPITLASDYDKEFQGTLGKTYRDVVAASFGGQFPIKQQEKRIIDPIKQKVQEAKSAYDSARQKAKDSFNDAKIDNASANQERGELRRDLIDSVRDDRRVLEDVAKSNYVSDVEKLKSVSKLDTKVQEMESAFRLKAITNSLPSGATSKEISDVLSTTNANSAMQKVDNLWLDHGFSMLKNKNFKLNTESLMNQIGKELKEDPIFAVNQAESLPILKNMSEFLIQRSPDGVIDGNSFTALRSQLGSRANLNSDSPQAVVQQMVFKSLQKHLDKQVRGQLSKKDIKQFDDQVSQWRTQILLRDAVTQASTAGNKGSFNGENWVRAIKNNSKSQARQGRGDLRKEADDLKTLSDLRTQELETSLQNSIKKATESKEKTLKQIRQQTASKLKRIRKKTSSASRLEKQTLRESQKRSENNKEIQSLLNDLEIVQKELDNLNINATKEKGIFANLAATGVLGTIGLGFGGISGAAAGVGAGILLGRGLATQTAQRAVAGQTGVQQKMRRSAEIASKPLNITTPGMFGLAGGRSESEKERYGY